MPETFVLPENVTQARKKAEQLTSTASDYAAGESTISDILSQKVRDVYADNRDILTGLDTATGNYLAAPSTAREQFQGVFNPFQRESLVDQYVSNALIPMLSYSSIYGQRMGRIEDTIGAGTRAYQAKSTRKANEAKAASGLYENLLNEYLKLEGLRQNERQLDISEISAKKSGGGGMDFGSILSEIAKILGGETQGQSMESPPMTSLPGRTDIEQEYPIGSGVFWISDGKGGWR